MKDTYDRCDSLLLQFSILYLLSMAEANNNADLKWTLEYNTLRLKEVLEERHEEIGWATAAVDIIETFSSLYMSETNESTLDLLYKIKELEKFITIDLVRHLAQGVCRFPYYFEMAEQHLATTSVLLSEKAISSKSVRKVDHLSAEIQVLCLEYGFCASLEAIYSVDEAQNLLEQLSTNLTNVGRYVGDVKEAACRLHLTAAIFNGMLQALTPGNISKMRDKFTLFECRLNKVFSEIVDKHVHMESDMVLQYLAGSHLLQAPFLKDIYSSDPSQVINSHMIHPGTRGWIFDRIAKWLLKSDTCLLFISAEQGAGKSALASALCKLHSHELLGRHFFEVSFGAGTHNQVNGLVQSLASDFCQILPEYLNYLDDKFNSTDPGDLLSPSWEKSYDTLLKEPIKSLFGDGKDAASGNQPRLIIIDGLDESSFTEWGNLQTFLKWIIRDFPTQFRILATVQLKHSGAFAVDSDDRVDSICFESRSWSGRHIKDIEVYLSSSVGAILSGEDERGTPAHARVDEPTLQNTMDDLLKCSAGRFDYAIQIMEVFAREMATGGQFLGSVRKAIMPMKRGTTEEYQEKVSSFASPYRSYRDKEGRSVDVRVMRQSHYLMDKSRVALIRGRHQIVTPGSSRSSSSPASSTSPV